jgi:hypothetical protein
VVALACAGAAAAHGTGVHRGLVSTVSGTRPPIPGLVVNVLKGHERISVWNLTRKRVVLFDAAGRPVARLAPGKTEAWADPRITWTGPLPTQAKLLRNWRIRGEAGGEPFAIVGFLGYAPPAATDPSGQGTSPWLIAAAVAVGVLALVGLAVGARFASRAPTS